MANTNDIAERLSAAVNALPVRPEAIKDRLLYGFMSMGELRPEAFPPEFAARAERIWNMVGLAPETVPRSLDEASLQVLSENRAVEAAQEIVALEYEFSAMVRDELYDR